MGEVNLTIHGKPYSIACDAGQEQRVAEMGRYVDSHLRDIASAGGATNESHLLVLTALVLADEVHDLRENLRRAQRATQQAPSTRSKSVADEEEHEILNAIEHLASRIETVAERIQKLQ